MKTATKEKSLHVIETELDLIFSKFIAFRDYKNGWNCFICGCKIPSKGNGETGHFIKRQYMPTRYSETNCNFICFDCNRDDKDHEKHYRFAMIRTYGIKEVERLESAKNGLQKFMKSEIQEMIDHYRMEVAKLSKEKHL